MKQKEYTNPFTSSLTRVRWSLLTLWLVLLILPPVIFLKDHSFLALTEPATAFPLFGLIAFSLIWSQIMIGAFLKPLSRFFPRLLYFHIGQGLVALGFALLHPLLLISSLSPAAIIKLLHFQLTFVQSTQVAFVYLGEISLLCLLLSIGAALLRNQVWIRQYWQWFHCLNYLVFFLIFFHSWNLGSDVQSSLALHSLWLFWFVTVVIALLYRQWYVPARQSHRQTK